MLKRFFNAAYLNEVANHPSVRGGAKLDLIDGPADFAALVENLDNILLCYDGGCFLLIKDGDDYEIHTMALKEGRGQKLRDAVVEMLTYLFERTDCQNLKTMAYKTNAAAVKLSQEFMRKEREDDEMIYYTLPRSEMAINWRAA